MAEFPAFPLWTDAYLGDTTHLTTIEHGAYMLLLIVAWRSKDGLLPNDDKLLARYTKLTASQWKRIRPILEPFFKVSSDSWRQGRLTDELTAVRQKSKKQSDNSKARWLKNKDSTNADVLPPDSRGNPSLNPTPYPTLKDKSFREREAPPEDFKNLVFEGEFLKVATEAGLSSEHGARSFEIWKIKRTPSPPKDALGDFWIWCLKEKKPVIQENLPTEKPLEGEDLIISQLGDANWKRRLSKTNSSYRPTPEQLRLLADYEKINGVVWWENLRSWKEKQEAAP